MNAFSIHAHFYQPPREDPLTGFIPVESNAAPYSNWNERIHSECYRPNADLGNFEQISFNIGPTLFNWMEKFDPVTCRKIIEQDQANLKRYGHGNAIAQAYNHTILPLSSYEDKFTQIFWGIADFAHKFGRLPGGMWLPETAVDYETLDVLARLGIRFTILAPWQASLSSLDCSQPYRASLSQGREISVFFYQKDLSARVSFEPHATVDADVFVREMLAGYFDRQKTRRQEPQFLMIATDGELYGHHQNLREHFLKRLVDGVSSGIDLKATFPELWLANHPPRETIQIKECTSWSCHHGIDRWTGSCDCTPGSREWKKQLRIAMDRLGGVLDQLYLEVCLPLIEDPWKLRNRYIHVLLGQLNMETLIGDCARRVLTGEETRRVHLLLEAQRERQRIFTSCGWFFEDFDRIEPKNNVAYAAQAVRLARIATGVDLEAQTMADLGRVTSQQSGVSAAPLFERHLRRAEGVKEVRIGYAD